MSAIPRHLGKYELQQQLGRGSVGEVWKAHDLELRRDVALKILHADLQSDPHFLTRFTTEGATIASLHHPNIVQVYDATITRVPESNETCAYLIMDYVEGRTLASYISATSHRGEFPEVAQIVYLFTSLSVAIDYAHQQGVIHGNITPGNIILNMQKLSQFQAGEPQLTDFGLSAILGNAVGIGTPHYISPEQARGDQSNTRSDIYALGVILYEMCTGVRPFRDESSVAVMMQHINMLPTPPILINPNIPPALSEVILRAMAKEIPTRFSMASLFAAAIADACSMQPTLRISPTKIPEEQTSTRGNSQASILGVPQPFFSSPSGFQHSPLDMMLPSKKNPPITPLPRPLVSAPLPPLSAPLPPLAAPDGRSSPSYPSLPINLAASPSATTKIPVIPSPIQASPAIAPGIPAPPPSNAFNISAQATTAMPRAQANAPAPPPPAISQPPPVPLAASFPPVQNEAPPPFPQTRPRRSLTDFPISIFIISLILLLIIVGGAIMESLFINNQGQANKTTGGHIFFQDDALGHDDQLRLEMQNVPPPPGGSSYYAWLQTTNQQSIPLGQLTVQGGNISLLYQGDNQHTNLLSIMQGLTITRETTDSSPHIPGNTVTYQAMVNTAIFQYIKNILYSTPHFPDNRGVLTGMLETIKSMNDKAGSIVDTMQGNHDPGLIRRQAGRIIEMIDGTGNARASGDLPAPYIAQLDVQVGLLSSATQRGYLDTLDDQLNQLKQTAGNNSALLQHIQNVENAITDLRDWVQKTRVYAVQILKAADLTDQAIISVALQLKQIAADSYTGRTIPPNQGPQPAPGSAGANQAYVEAQYMAALDLQPI